MITCEELYWTNNHWGMYVINVCFQLFEHHHFGLVLWENWLFLHELLKKPVTSEPSHWKMLLRAYADRKGLDESVDSPSLLMAFAIHFQNNLGHISTCAMSHPDIYSTLIHSIVSNGSVSRQQRPWSDCAFAQSEVARKICTIWYGPLLSALAPKALFFAQSGPFDTVEYTDEQIRSFGDSLYCLNTISTNHIVRANPQTSHKK